MSGKQQLISMLGLLLRGWLWAVNENKQALFQSFISYSITELKDLLKKASERDEVLFYQRMIALKLGLAQEKVVGKELL